MFNKQQNPRTSGSQYSKQSGHLEQVDPFFQREPVIAKKEQSSVPGVNKHNVAIQETQRQQHSISNGYDQRRDSEMALSNAMPQNSSQ